MSIKRVRWLCTAAGMLSFIGGIALGRVQSDDRMIIIGRVTGYDIEFGCELALYLSILGLLTSLVIAVSESKPSYKTLRTVFTVFGVIFVEIPLTILLFILMVDWGRSPDHPEKLKSPDGKHCIIKTKATVEGCVGAEYYVRDKGVVYRLLFEDRHADTTLEWTDNGVIFDNKLYEY